MEMKYCKEAPSNQTIVDILKGSWFSAFPDEYGVVAGDQRSFELSVDMRVNWGGGALSKSIKGSTILELGPFEAFHTYQFEQLGAQSVLSIEASNINYLKCLIVKEITGLKSRFLYGDFIPYLEQCDDRFDIVWASGVLYHQAEPLKLLGLISKITDRLFIHTHYYAEDIIRKKYPYPKDFRAALDEIAEYEGYQAKLHYRSYKREMVGTIFGGGTEMHSYWMEQQDIFDSLRHFGFDKFQIGVDDTNNPMGPAMVFVAEK